MGVAIKGDVTDHLAALTENNGALALGMAKKLVDRMGPDKLREYLVPADTLLDYLVTRLQQDPESLLPALAALAGDLEEDAAAKPAEVEVVEEPEPKVAEEPEVEVTEQPEVEVTEEPEVEVTEQPEPEVAPKPAKKKPGRKPAKPPLTPEAFREKADLVLSFLQENPWSPRAKIVQAAQLETAPVYTFVMGQLRADGQVITHGQRTKMVYGTAGTPSPEELAAEPEVKAEAMGVDKPAKEAKKDKKAKGKKAVDKPAKKAKKDKKAKGKKGKKKNKTKVL